MKTAVERFTTAVTPLGINLPEPVMIRLVRFLEILLEANQTTNLTAITDFQDALFKHIYDSLTVLTLTEFQQARTILDVGSGAGIPGIPLAIVCPEKRFVSMEATRKKIDFQNQVVTELQVPNLTTIWGRMEDYGNTIEHREQYDAVLSRALAATNTLAELTLPFIKINGVNILYKSGEYQNELQQAKNAIMTLGGSLQREVVLQLPEDYGERSLIVIRKIHPTPVHYPRRSGQPQKKPL